MWDCIINHALVEIEEELIYEGGKLQKSDLIPFVGCFSTHLNKLDILFLVKRKAIKPKSWEGVSIEPIKISDLEAWIKNNQNRIPEILGNYLYYIASKF